MAEIDTDRIHVTVMAGDLARFLERATWTPAMLHTLDAEEYRKTIEARIRLRDQLTKTVNSTLLFHGFGEAVSERRTNA